MLGSSYDKLLNTFFNDGKYQSNRYTIRSVKAFIDGANILMVLLYTSTTTPYFKKYVFPLCKIAPLSKETPSVK